MSNTTTNSINRLAADLTKGGIRFHRTALPCGTPAIVTEHATYLPCDCEHGVYTADAGTHKLLSAVLRHGEAQHAATVGLN